MTGYVCWRCATTIEVPDGTEPNAVCCADCWDLMTAEAIARGIVGDRTDHEGVARWVAEAYRQDDPRGWLRAQEMERGL